MLVKAILQCLLYCLFLSALGTCQNSGQTKGPRYNSLQGQTIASQYMDYEEKHYQCAVTSTIDTEGVEVYTLNVYKKNGDSSTTVFQYETIDYFVGFSMINNCLMTTWIGGSSFHFKVFGLIDNQIRLVFDGGSHNLPEIADVNNDGSMEILISEGAILESNGIITYPEKTLIYTWHEDSFVLLRESAWQNRFGR